MLVLSGTSPHSVPFTEGLFCMGLSSRSLKPCNKSLLKEGREDNQVNSLLWVFERRMFFCQKFSFSLIASLVAQLVKDPPAMQETLVGFLGWEDPLKEG